MFGVILILLAVFLFFLALFFICLQMGDAREALKNAIGITVFSILVGGAIISLAIGVVLLAGGP